LDTSVSISRPGHVRRRVMNEPWTVHIQLPPPFHYFVVLLQHIALSAMSNCAVPRYYLRFSHFKVYKIFH
jgi:hypothetical protein